MGARAIAFVVVAIGTLLARSRTRSRTRKEATARAGRRRRGRDAGADDELGAFVESERDATMDGRESGALRGMKFAVKDIFDVRGRRCGFGSPAFEATAGETPKRNAECVDDVLNAGASAIGMTTMDELAYAVNGENPHYGTPINPRARNLIPGGSSSGSAVACAGRASRVRLRVGHGYRGIGAHSGVLLRRFWDSYEPWIGVDARCAGLGAEFRHRRLVRPIHRRVAARGRRPPAVGG